MREGYFISELRRVFLSRGCFFHKIPDSIATSGSRFSTLKKFDAFIIYKGMFAGIECKLVKGASIAIDRFRNSQIDSFADLRAAGAPGYFLINHRYKAKNNVIVWTLDDFIIARTIAKGVGRKSINLTIGGWPTLVKSHGWNVDPLFQMMNHYYGGINAS